MDDVDFLALTEALVVWADDRFGSTAGYVVAVCLVGLPLALPIAIIALIAR